MTGREPLTCHKRYVGGITDGQIASITVPQLSPHADADVKLVAAALCPQRPDLAVGDARAVLDALVAAGWRRLEGDR